MSTYYVDSRATGLNNGDKDAALGPDENGIYQNAFQSIAAISGVSDAGHTIHFVAGSGPYRIHYGWAGVTNNIIYAGNWCKISGGIELNDGTYKWTPSAHGTNEYYCELLAGGSPSFAEVNAAIIEGWYYELSAEESQYQRGTPGSLSDLQIGFGDNDGLGFSTVYVRSDSVNPSELAIEIAKRATGYSSNYVNITFNDFIFELFNDAAIYTRAASGTTRISRCIFKYINNESVYAFGAGDVIVDGCLGYFCGHRFVSTLTLTGDLNIFNSCAIKSHLFLLTHANDSGVVTLKNNIAYLVSNGAIDKSGTLNSIDEDYNCWYPSFTGNYNKLGYVHDANWPTTGPHDFPPSASTSIATVIDLLEAGGQDPRLSGIDPNAIERMSDAELRAIRLQTSSPCLRSGVNIGPGYYYLDGSEIPDV